MELRHIRYFLAVAEEGNFTRAAERLGIAQPPLSLQIKALEREIGAPLFHRVPHGAELTEAGQAFLDIAQTLPARVNDAVRAARQAVRGETGRLSLGFTGSAGLNPVVSAGIRDFRRAFPAVGLTLTETNSAALVRGLMDGSLDAAVIRPSESDPDALQVHRLIEEPLVAVLPLAHPQARGRAGLDLARLAHDPLILTPRSVGFSLYDAAISACRAAGFSPIMGEAAPQITSILSLVAAELGFSLVPASMQQLIANGVAYRKVRAPATYVGLAVACRKHRPPAPALNFVNLIRKEAGQSENSAANGMHPRLNQGDAP